MKKELAIFSTALLLNPAASATEIFGGRTTAMGGAGVAGGDYTAGAILNPANTSFYRDDDDFAGLLNIGAVADEREDFLDVGDELDKQLDQLDGALLRAEDIRNLSSLLDELDRGGIRGEVGAQFSLAVPNELLSAVLFARQNALISAGFHYSDRDRAYLENPTAEPFDESSLTSSATARGYSVREIGLALGHSFATGHPEWRLSVGATPKHQAIETIEYTAAAGDYDIDDLDADTYTLEETALNLDLGATLVHGKTRFGISAHNLVEDEYETVNGNRVPLETRVTAGAGYNGETLTAVVDLDLTSSLVPGSIDSGAEETQFARAGVEVDMADWIQLRLGYRHDLEGSVEDTASAGIGFSPFDVLHLHLAALKSSDDTLGAAFEFGLDL